MLQFPGRPGLPRNKMSIRKVVFSIGEYYHLYNRGIDKRIIFTDSHDHRRFAALLYVCNSSRPVDINTHFQEGRAFLELFSTDRGEEIIDIVAYCLMPNHFHLLVHEKVDGGITKFMGKLSTAYSMYFNAKNARTGALFEGRFKAKHADTDEYLKYLFAYIHLNPIKLVDPLWKENGVQNRAVAQDYLADYMYSSNHDWKGNTRLESKILNKAAAPEYFVTTKDFNDFVNEWLTFSVE